jgi:hypothetical protein
VAHDKAVHPSLRWFIKEFKHLDSVGIELANVLARDNHPTLSARGVFLINNHAGSEQSI